MEGDSGPDNVSRRREDGARLTDILFIDNHGAALAKGNISVDTKWHPESPALLFQFNPILCNRSVTLDWAGGIHQMEAEILT